MNEMRKLMQIVEGNASDNEKQKIDESILGMVDVPVMNAVSEDRSREEYETHITKDSYAPHNAMGDVQMEETECDSDDEHDEDLDEAITVVHEEDLSESDEDDDKDDDDKDDDECESKENLEEGEVDAEILEWMKRLER